MSLRSGLLFPPPQDTPPRVAGARLSALPPLHMSPPHATPQLDESSASLHTAYVWYTHEPQGGGSGGSSMLSGGTGLYDDAEEEAEEDEDDVPPHVLQFHAARNTGSAIRNAADNASVSAHEAAHTATTSTSPTVPAIGAVSTTAPAPAPSPAPAPALASALEGWGSGSLGGVGAVTMDPRPHEGSMHTALHITPVAGSMGMPGPAAHRGDSAAATQQGASFSVAGGAGVRADVSSIFGGDDSFHIASFAEDAPVTRTPARKQPQFATMAPASGFATPPRPQTLVNAAYEARAHGQQAPRAHATPLSQARAALADAVSASRLEDSRNSSSISQTAADARGHASTISKSSTSQAEADAHMHTSAISAALSAAGVHSAGRGEVARLNLLLSAAAINERQARAAAADASARASSAQQDARQARDSAQTAQRERDAMFERCQLLEFIVKQLPPAWVQHWLGDSEKTVPDLSPTVCHDIDLSLRALRGVALHASTDKCAALEARVAELSRRLADAMQPRLEEETRQEVERQAWAAEVSQLTDCLDTATALHTAKMRELEQELASVRDVLNEWKTRAQVAEARAAEREQVVEQLAGALESSTSAAEALHHQLSQAEEAIQVLGDELTVRDRELATYASVTQEAQREAQRAVAYYDVTAAPGHPRTAPPALPVQQHAGAHSLAGVTQPVVPTPVPASVPAAARAATPASLPELEQQVRLAGEWKSMLEYKLGELEDHVSTLLAQVSMIHAGDETELENSVTMAGVLDEQRVEITLLRAQVRALMSRLDSAVAAAPTAPVSTPVAAPASSVSMEPTSVQPVVSEPTSSAGSMGGSFVAANNTTLDVESSVLVSQRETISFLQRTLAAEKARYDERIKERETALRLEFEGKLMLARYENSFTLGDVSLSMLEQT